MNEYHHTERRRTRFTDEEIEEIADLAAERVMEKVYSEIGKGVFKKFSFIVGTMILAAFAWLVSKGYIEK